MDKKELIDELEDVVEEMMGIDCKDMWDRGYIKAAKEILAKTNQLDEPEITEEQAWNKIAETLPVNSAELKEGITRVAFSNPINLSAWEAVTGKTDFEPTKPIRLNDFVKRLNEIGEHNRDCWINSILRNFGNEYGTAKYQAGYEQGIFDGTMESKEKELVEVPQFVADWIEGIKSGEIPTVSTGGDDLIFEICQQFYEETLPKELRNWFEHNVNSHVFYNAVLDGYTIETPKTLQVIVKNYDSTVYKTELPEDEAIKLIEGWKE